MTNAMSLLRAHHPHRIHILLFSMMFTVYFLMGTSMITLAIYMNQAGMREYIVYAVSSFPLSMMISPLLSGAIADRYFPANKMIATLFILCGCILLLVVYFSHRPLLFVVLFFLYKLLYAPTVGLANSVAMTHVTDRNKFFPLIRIGGTVGWIAAAALISLLQAEKTATPFIISGSVAIVTGLIYLFILPHTPPAAGNSVFRLRDITGADAFRTLDRPGSGFRVFVLCCCFATMLSTLYDQYAPLYFNVAGLERTAAFMSVGQVSEVLVTALIPLFALRFSLKTIMVMGLLAIVLRYSLLLTSTTYPGLTLALIAIALHGFIMGFYIIVSQMVTDMMAPPSIRAQAQSLMMFISMGAGSLLGSLVMGNVLNIFVNDVNNLAQWRIVWLIPVVAGVITLLIFIFGFKNPVVCSTSPVEETHAKSDY